MKSQKQILVSTTILLLAMSFFASSANAVSKEGTTTIVSSGSKVIGTIPLTTFAQQARAGGSKQLIITEEWQVTKQVVGPLTTYTSHNKLSFSCFSGTDWAEQEGQIVVTNGQITGFWNPADTWQGYTYLGCGVNFAQTANQASNLGDHVHYYTTGNLQACVFICENFGYYYQTTDLYTNGSWNINDWCTGTPQPPCSSSKT